jgi:hypothetical protein
MRRIDPLLGNGSVNTFQQTSSQQYGSGVFCGPCCARCYAARSKHFTTIMDVFSALWDGLESIQVVQS